MPALADPTLWRTQPYTVSSHIYIHEPEVIFQAQMNEPDAENYRYPNGRINFDNVTTGVFTDVLPELTVLFGTTPGGDDLGRNRVKEITASVLTIGYSSQGVGRGEFTVEDNAYITVINLREIWSKIPRIKPDGTMFKDGDIVLDDGSRNYGLEPGPLVGIGSGWCGFADPISGNATVPLPPDNIQSYSVTAGATPLTYLWDVGDGTISSGVSTDATIEVDFPIGFRYISLTITDNNGNSRTAYAPIYVHDPDVATDYVHLTSYELNEGGTGPSIGFNLLDTTIQFTDGTLVMMWEVESYGDTVGSLSGPLGYEHIKFIGWHDTTQNDVQAGEGGALNVLSLTAISLGERLRRLPAFDQVVERTDSPTKWTEMDLLITGRYIWYLINWHTTAFENGGGGIIIDIGGLGADIPILSSTAGNFWQQVEVVANATNHTLACDKYGVLHLEHYELRRDVADRTATSIITLTANDIASIQIEDRPTPDVHWLEGSAILTSYTIGALDAVLCIAPGKAPSQGSNRAQFGKQVVEYQSQLNSRAGHEYARLNAKIKRVTITLAHNGDAGIDPALQEWVTLDLDDTVVNGEYVFDNVRCMPLSVSISYSNDEVYTKTTTLTLFPETEGIPAQTKYVPISPVRASEPPHGTPPVIPDPKLGPSIDLRTRKMALLGENGHIAVTDDASVPSSKGGPVWELLDTLTFSGTILDLIPDPFSPRYIGTGSVVNGWVVTSTDLYRIGDVFGSPNISSRHTFGATVTTRSVYASRIAQNWVIVASTVAGTGSQATYTTDDSTYTEISVSGNAANGQSPQCHLSYKTPGTAWMVAYNGSAYVPYITDDYGATWNEDTARPWDFGTTVGTGLAFWLNSSPNENRAYIGTNEFTYNGVWIVSGSNQTEITPEITAVQYGPNDNYGKYGLSIDPNNSNRLAVLGVTTGVTNDYTAFASANRGTSWTQITPIVTVGAGNEAHFERLYISDHYAGMIVMWGTKGKFAISTNFGGTMDDRSGNLLDEIPTFGDVIGVFEG